MGAWFPVSRSEEIPRRHIGQTQLLGQEIALWRNDAGEINAWENRCPHRGVRLSIGIHTGTELICQYHGWRFASGSAQCTYIPAHPGQKPASSVRATPFRVAEKHRFIWASLDADADVRKLPDWPGQAGTTLRSMYVAAPAGLVIETLLEGYLLSPSTPGRVALTDPHSLEVRADSSPHEPGLRLLLQPATESHTVIHGLLSPAIAAAARFSVLRFHNAQLGVVRDAAELVVRQRRPL